MPHPNSADMDATSSLSSSAKPLASQGRNYTSQPLRLYQQTRHLGRTETSATVHTNNAGSVAAAQGIVEPRSLNLKRKWTSTEATQVVDNGLGAELASDASQAATCKRTKTEPAEVGQREHSLSQLEANITGEGSAYASTNRDTKHHHAFSYLLPPSPEQLESHFSSLASSGGNILSSDRVSTSKPSAPKHGAKVLTSNLSQSRSNSTRSQPSPLPSSQPISPVTPSYYSQPLTYIDVDVRPPLVPEQAQFYAQYPPTYHSYPPVGTDIYYDGPISLPSVFLPPPPPTPLTPQHPHQPHTHAQPPTDSSWLYQTPQSQPRKLQHPSNSTVIQQHADLIMEEMAKIWLSAKSVGVHSGAQRSEVGVQSEESEEVAKAKLEDGEIEEERARSAFDREALDAERVKWAAEKRLFEEENTRMKAVVEKLEETIIKLEGRIGGPAEIKKEEMYAERLELERKVEGLEEGKGQLEGKVKEMAEEHECLRAAKAQLEDKSSELEEKIKVYEEEKKKQQTVVVKLEGLVSRLEEEKRGLSETVDTLRVQQQQEVQHREKIQAANLRIKAEQGGLEATITRLEKENIHFERLAHDVEREMKEQKQILVAEVERRVADLSEQRTKLAEREKEVETERVEIIRSNEIIASKKRKLEEELAWTTKDRKADTEKLHQLERDEKWASEALRKEIQSRIKLAEEKKSWEKEKSTWVTERKKLKSEARKYKGELERIAEASRSRPVKREYRSPSLGWDK
ncbi:hypothetical protein GALMADRAFT_734772 [Galerina marginata CBS 339.88]|uniref:Uncharacterized protein n=1 Tax=Galerina marginata (strain CBS 339.88) TaxID=685588 RepID=A0A067SPE4_GALM3|nr:hypothetical protein GALMADRAFT_734772 [Galerina marginata CBS 339.88]